MEQEFHRLFTTELATLYQAEKQWIKLLPQLEKAARHPDLKQALQHRIKQSEQHLEWLGKICRELKIDPMNAKPLAMHGFIQETESCLHLTCSSEVKDAALIGAAQRMEHYWIAAYGIAKAYAKHLHLSHYYPLLKQCLQSAKEMNRQLNHIAEGTLFFNGINDYAAKRAS